MAGGLFCLNTDAALKLRTDRRRSHFYTGVNHSEVRWVAWTVTETDVYILRAEAERSRVCDVGFTQSLICVCVGDLRPHRSKRGHSVRPHLSAAVGANNNLLLGTLSAAWHRVLPQTVWLKYKSPVSSSSCRSLTEASLSLLLLSKLLVLVLVDSLFDATSSSSSRPRKGSPKQSRGVFRLVLRRLHYFK